MALASRLLREKRHPTRRSNAVCLRRPGSNPRAPGCSEACPGRCPPSCSSIGCPRVGAHDRARRALCQPDGGRRDISLALPAREREVFDAPAIAIPGGAAHMAVDISGIGAEDLFHLADAFEEVAPVVKLAMVRRLVKQLPTTSSSASCMEERRRCRPRSAHLRLSQGARPVTSPAARGQDGEDTPAEHDRQRPDFADGQRLGFLVEGDKAAHAPISSCASLCVTSRCADVVDARQPRSGPSTSLGNCP